MKKKIALIVALAAAVAALTTLVVVLGKRAGKGKAEGAR